MSKEALQASLRAVVDGQNSVGNQAHRAYMNQLMDIKGEHQAVLRSAEMLSAGINPSGRDSVVLQAELEQGFPRLTQLLEDVRHSQERPFDETQKTREARAELVMALKETFAQHKETALSAAKEASSGVAL